MRRIHQWFKPSALLFVLSVGFVHFVSARIRGENGTISLLVAVPLTKNNQTVLDPGWFHMASALLAVDHFNARSVAIVPELSTASNEIMRNCNIRFGDVQAVDTGTNSHQAMEYVVEELQHNGPFDAIAGPYNEIPALELSVLATGMEAPIVCHRAFDSNLLLPERHPYFSQVSADFRSRMQFVSNYLKHIGRNNYIAVLYSSTASEIQQADIVTTILEQDGFDQVATFSYKAPKSTDDTEAERSIHDALEKIRNTGFRTIYVLPSRLDRDTPIIGKAATDFALDRGEHMWVLSGGVAELSATEIAYFLSTFGARAPFLQRSAYFYAVDDYEPKDFSKMHLERQTRAFLERVEELNPISNYFGDWFHNRSIHKYPIQRIVEDSGSFTQGSSYMYDAVLAIGLGACKATFDNIHNDSAMTGRMHLDGIRSIEFHGASGKVAFGDHAGSPGSRMVNTIPFAIVNLLPEGATGPLYVHTETFDPLADEWIQYASFVYADGRSTPPDHLRDEPGMNYLNPIIRGIGLSLMAIALLCVLLSVIWVYVYRNHSVVIAAQPTLLYTLCFGSAMVALVILLNSYDESYGWDDEMLDRACVGAVWIDVLGGIISYSALFTKLWRVNRCMRYKTNQIEVWRVMWPSVLLITAVIGVLTAFTVSSSYHWERHVTNEISGESIGRCNGDDNVAYLATISVLNFVPTVLAGIMAWKASGIDDLYSESKWVLAFILVQMQVLLVGAPVIALLQDVNSNIRYISYTLLTFTFPMSTMGLIILPKVLIIRRMEKHASAAHTPSTPVAESVPIREPDETPIATAPFPGSTGESRLPGRRQPRSNHGPMIQIVTFD